jgi:predicted aldo/keto reductase-like oxidoreductase
MNNQIEIIEVADQYINTIAMWTGTRAAAITNFLKANQLDAVKLAADLSRNATEERKDFASAISGYADNEYLINL